MGVTMSVGEGGAFPQSEAIKIGFPAPSRSSPPDAEALDEELQNLELEENENLDLDTASCKDEDSNPRFPLRPAEPDCAFYLRTGACKFGLLCKFNHPIRKNQEREQVKLTEEEKDTADLTEKTGLIECKYYLTAGGCKFGKACRYSHAREPTTSEESVEYNFLGLPIRPGEKECPFYMRNGSCKFSSNCKFNHPDPTAVEGIESPSVYQNCGSAPLQPSAMPWPVQNAHSELPSHHLDAASPPYVAPLLSSPNRAPSNQGWNQCQVPINPLLPHEWNLQKLPSSVASSTNEATNMAGSFSQLQQTTVVEFPERPGEPECQYYMKTGNCKFKSACRFHHPKMRPAKPPPCPLSPLGLPLRPDQVICSYYSRYGICKFGASCKFDHPVNHA